MKMFGRDHGYRAIGTRFGQSVHGHVMSCQKEYIPKRIHTVFTTQNIISKPTNQLSVQIIKWKLQGIRNLDFPKRRIPISRNYKMEAALP